MKQKYSLPVKKVKGNVQICKSRKTYLKINRYYLVLMCGNPCNAKVPSDLYPYLDHCQIEDSIQGSEHQLISACNVFEGRGSL